MARRSKFEPERVAKILQAIETGATYRIACAYAGISFETFNEWRKHKAEFSEQVHEAEGRGALANLAVIKRAGQGVVDAQGNLVQPPDWRAASWLLERRHADEYGKTVSETTIKGDDDHPVSIKLVRG